MRMVGVGVWLYVEEGLGEVLRDGDLALSGSFFR